MILNKEELLAVNRFLCCRGLAVIGRGDQVETYRKAVVNGFVYNSAKLAKSKLKNSYTVQYHDAKGNIQFGEIQRFLILKNHHAAIITKLRPSGSLMSGIKSPSQLLNNLCNSGVLIKHLTVTKTSLTLFCIPLCNIKRICIVVSTSGDDTLAISTFLNLVEHD